MKLEGSINGISIQKTGVKVTFMLDEVNKEFAMQTLSKFVDKPITLELLVDTKRVIEDFDKISDDQRKKIYALIKEFASEYGDTEDNVKIMLKLSCHNEHGTPKELSFSDCTKTQANVFIEHLLSVAQEQGYDVGREHQEQDPVYYQCIAAIESKACVVCNKAGLVLKNHLGRICLCNEHKEEMLKSPHVNFMDKYHLLLV